MVEKLKVEIKGSLIYWVCDSQSNYVQFNIALKYDPEGSYFFKKKNLIFNICLEYILFKITEDKENTNVYHSLWYFKNTKTKMTGDILMKTEDSYGCEVS